MKQWRTVLMRGAGAGALATVPMSLVMWIERRLGLLGEPPPRQITERLLAATGARPHRPYRRGLAWLSHLAFGLSAGALFAPVSARLRPRAGRSVAGALYGATVWASMYGYILPALGLMQKPPRDRRGRQISMVMAHLVYGATLGAVLPGGWGASPAHRESSKPPWHPGRRMAPSVTGV